MTFQTTQGAYISTLQQVVREGERSSPRGEPILELLNHSFTVLEPRATPIEVRDPELNERIAKYTRAEFDLYNGMAFTAEQFAKAAPFWRKIANPDGTVNSAYGDLLFNRKSVGRSKFAKHGPLTPWQWAELSLKQDRDSRQAFIRFSLPRHQWFGNKDQVCTMHGQFMIRGGVLHLTIVMRSNDTRRGLIYDMPWFCSLIPRMIVDLQSHYPDLKIGTYTHFAHSQHIYLKDMPEVQRILGRTE